jgi:tellurite resistance protein
MTNADQMIYRVAFRMAMADGKLSTNEMVLLGVLAKSLDVPETEVPRLEEEAARIDYTALPRVLPDRADQLRLFESALLLAMADGVSDPLEWNLANRLAASLHLEKAEAQPCLERARQRLRDLARDHLLAPEIRENLAKQGL